MLIRHSVAEFGDKPRLVILLWLLTLLSLMPTGQSQASMWDEAYFPNVELLTQEGKRVRFYDDLLRNKIVVFNFIYTNCPDICSLSTARLAQVQALLGDRVGRDVHFYSISLDPANDTPEVLARYAGAFNIAPGWTFLTGDVKDVALIRHKLGERSRSLEEHRADIMLGNARTGEWERTSSFQEIDRIALTILDMDPAWRAQTVERTLQPDARIPSGDFSEQVGLALFVKACSACHTIGGGDLIGPDLKHVGKRREHTWLARFLADPERMRAEKDPIATELDARFDGVSMPNLGLSDVDIADLLHYIAKRSAQTVDPISLTTGPSDHNHDHDHSSDHGSNHGSNHGIGQDDDHDRNGHAHKQH